jgi:putative transposase
MPDVMVVLACLSQWVEPTTRRQLGRVIEALLSLSGRVTMKGLSRWSDKGGNRDREVPRGFLPPTPPGIRVRTMAVRWGSMH